MRDRAKNMRYILENATLKYQGTERDALVVVAANIAEDTLGIFFDLTTGKIIRHGNSKVITEYAQTFAADNIRNGQGKTVFHYEVSVTPINIDTIESLNSVLINRGSIFGSRLDARVLN